MLSFRCGQCGKGLAVGDDLAGKPVRCPGCGKVVTAPQPAVKVLEPKNAAPSNLVLTIPGDGVRPDDTPSASALESRGDTVMLDEDARKRFETAWRAGTPVTIESILAGQRVTHYLATLEELVHIDLEFQWKAWSETALANSTLKPPAVESYLARFPKLNQPDILQRFVETEFRVRQRLGDKPALADYRGRFPSIKFAQLDPQAGPDVTGFLAPAQKPDELGRLGPYRVLEVLGRGGMGVVFKAEDTLLQRMVALKAMLPALAGSPTAKERFFREARAAASLKHPHIVTIHQVGEDRGAPFLAMEFLEGESLDDRLKREKKLPIADVLRIGVEVAEGLACAHDKGLIHRDIKPANLWLETGRQRDGETERRRESESLRPSVSPSCVKILDFGLARALAEQTQLTQSGVIVGTPAYMAPEQAGGKEVDHRADLFSLGCVLYRACTGEMPFKGNDTMSILSAIALQAPTPPAQLNPEVPQTLSEVIMALLAKEANERPATAAEVVRILRELAADGNDTALLRFDPTRKSTAPMRPRIPLRTRLQALRALAVRKNRPLLAGGVALLAIVLIFALASRERQRPEQGVNGTDGGGPDSARFLLTFDGNSKVPIPSLVLDPTGPMTVEAIVTVGEPRKHVHVVGTINQFAIQLTRLNPEFRLRWDPGLSSLRSKSEVDPGRPVHLAGVLDKTVFRGFVDGRQVVHTQRQGNGLNKTGLFQLGADHFTGSIREVRISKTARYDKDFKPQQRFEPDGDTLALYHCDEGSGDVLKDSSGNGHDGKIVGAKWVRNDASPYDQLRRADIDPYELKIAGSGDAAKAAPELVAIFGDSRLRHGRGLRWDFYDWVGSATFSPKGDRLASVDADGMIRIWDARSGQQLHVLDIGGRWPKFNFTCAYLFFSPDGAKLSFLADGVVRTWDMASDSVKDLPVRHTGALVLQMSEDGKTVATQAGDGRINVWDLSAGKPRISLTGDSFATGGLKQNMTATACALSPDGKRLAFVKEKTIYIWSIPDNHAEQSLQVKSTRGFLAFSSDGKLLGIPEGIYNGCRIWDLKAKTERQGPPCLSMAFSPDSRFLAVNGELWDIALGKPHLGQQPFRDWMAFSPQGQLFASTRFHRPIKIRDLLGNDQCRDHSDESLIVHGAETSKEIIVFADDAPSGQLRFWDLQSRRARTLPTSTASILSLQPSPDGKKLALSQILGIVNVLDGMTGATLHTVKPPAGFASEGHCACVNADCSLVVTGGPKGVMLWELQKKRQRELPIPLGGVKFAFTVDSKLLAGNGEKLSIWDLERDRLVTDFRLPGHLLGENTLMRASPDSTLLGVGLAETVYLIDLATGEITKEFPKQELLAFSSDGKRLATTSGSKLSIWEPKSGTRERQIDLGLGQVPAFLDYAPDGRHIVVGNANGTVFVLRLARNDER